MADHQPIPESIQRVAHELIRQSRKVEMAAAAEQDPEARRILEAAAADTRNVARRMTERAAVAVRTRGVFTRSKRER